VFHGRSLFAYHNRSPVSLTNKDYWDAEGATYTGASLHPAFQVINPDHPITSPRFRSHREQHYMTYDKDPNYVLAGSINEDGWNRRT